MWKELLNKYSDQFTIETACSESEIEFCEKRLGTALPEELRSCLLEVGSVDGEWGEGLLWPPEKIGHKNEFFRTDTEFSNLYMSFQSLLLFGADVGGDHFAVPIQTGRVQRPDIFLWKHETDERVWAAPSLAMFFRWRAEGRIDL